MRQGHVHGAARAGVQAPSWGAIVCVLRGGRKHSNGRVAVWRMVRPQPLQQVIALR